MPPVAFYVKCRPQRADIAFLVKDEKRVFVGYPPWRRGATRTRADIRGCMLDVSRDADWQAEQLDPSINRSYKGRITQNRTLAREVGEDSICCVPRPGEGIVYLCRVGPFELVDDPAWADAYLNHRRAHRLDDVLDEMSHIGDVVQSWPIKAIKPVPFTALPRWISYRLLSRQSSGIIGNGPEDGRSALETLERLFEGQSIADFSPTTDQKVVEGRLLEFLSPSSFEHLVVELLQLEAKAGERWWHVGGSGDGGVDGLGANSEGTFAVLQCKWMTSEKPTELGMRLKQQNQDAHVYVAVLHDTHAYPDTSDPTIWTRPKVAELLIKHRHRCGMAITLGVE